MSQLGFDWDRAERDRWIDEADLLPESMESRGSTVKRHWMVNMLRTLNGFVSAQSPECWASQKLLAVKMGLRSPTEPDSSERGLKTVQRTLDALSELSLIIVHRRVPKGGIKPVNHYRLVWSELMLLSSQRRALLLPQSSKKQPDYSAEQQDYSGDQQDFLDEQQDFLDEQQDFLDEQQDFLDEQQDLKSCNLLLTSNRSTKPSPPSIPPQVLTKEEEEEKEGFSKQDLARLGQDSVLDRLVEEYSRESVCGAAELLGRAMHRVGSEYLERLLEYYRARRGAWGPGALNIRVRNSQPGLSIDAGWPTPKEVERPETHKSVKKSTDPGEFMRRRQAACQAAQSEPGMAEQMRAALQIRKS